MKHLSFTLLFSFLFLQLLGQGNNISSLLKSNMTKADEAYEYLDFRTAQYYYLKALDKEPNNKKARLRVAECFLKLDNSTSAEGWLAGLVADPDTELSIKLLYTEVLRKNENYTEAQKWYQRILDEYGAVDDIALKLEFLNNLDYYTRNPELFELTNLGVNSDQSDFSPQFKGGDLVFISSRKQETLIQYQPSTAHNDDEVMLKYFHAPLNSLENQETVLPLANGELLKSKYHDGPLFFYNSEKNVSFTRNNTKNVSMKDGVKLVNLEIFFASCAEDGTWNNVREFPFNSSTYSVGHPTLDRQGTILYFSSNMPGGFGGSDIYYSAFGDGKWGVPVNAGGNINTSGDELYPYLQTDGILFFASTGHGGFGGLDLFVCTRNSLSFSKPINLGQPLNSAQDDFSILLSGSGKDGFIASNRSGGHGLDDLYAFSTNYLFVIGTVAELMNEGTIIPFAEISISGDLSAEALSIQSDENGQFRIDLPFDTDYVFSVKKDGYTLLENIQYSTKGRSLGYDSIFLPMWKQELFVKGRVFSYESQSLLDNATVTISNLDDGSKQAVITMADGTYSTMVFPNTKYRIEAEHEGFIPGGFNLNTRDLYRGDLRNDLLLEEIFVDKAVVFYEYDKWGFNKAAHPELEEILKTIKRFPGAMLNITAHADSRGTLEYNQKLSDKRLQGMLNYFSARGIKKTHITGRSFGEALLLNTCSDGVECLEDQHSQNRRIEIKVQVPLKESAELPEIQLK